MKDAQLLLKIPFLSKSHNEKKDLPSRSHHRILRKFRLLRLSRGIQNHRRFSVPFNLLMELLHDLTASAQKLRA